MLERRDKKDGLALATTMSFNYDRQAKIAHVSLLFRNHLRDIHMYRSMIQVIQKRVFEHDQFLEIPKKYDRLDSVLYAAVLVHGHNDVLCLRTTMWSSSVLNS
ncbi:uncharacterized protein PHALS_08928 [Plasmopara halstedii]|uniref:Uncharacterized protein n=1 Tax=Plasmopara halstedii TaxID=4781 RepID=A0A0P1AD45_PLAHL|nr:uncharacterized protein PHALS_08928 [Plasmopara halstedii]CEG38881.1 hypothetical protein PHALS_08928 [Plasmopara halstedii]|eukprot:XP_024575250.1 hypothetical protein PHALS_08928 [Plasmopara halstedii]